MTLNWFLDIMLLCQYVGYIYITFTPIKERSVAYFKHVYRPLKNHTFVRIITTAGQFYF